MTDYPALKGFITWLGTQDLKVPSAIKGQLGNAEKPKQE